MSTVPPKVDAIPGGESGMPKSGGMEGGRKKTAWMTHVKATMRAHKGMKLMQVLKMAKKTYKKAKRGGGGGSGANASVTPALVGGRRRRSTRRSRRGGQDD